MRTVTVLMIVLIAGCHAGSAPSKAKATAQRGPKPAPEPSESGKVFRLADEPAGGKGVLDVRKDSRNGDEVVIVGRIGGSVKPFTGQAAFTIVDPSIVPCNENGDDACPTPWDYCCGVGKEQLAKATALIKLVGDDGRTRGDDARTMLGLTELQTVVVRGKALRDDAGNLAVALSGVYVRPGKATP